MNTNTLKKFAQETRRKLMQQVAAKLDFVTNNDTPELREKAEQVRKLKEEIKAIGKEQVVDKVAYTWFNRFMALRFMDANDYQPLGVRVLSPLPGQTTPEILNQAKQGDIPAELKLKPQKILDLLDGRTPSSNPQNEAYKELLIASCNHLHAVLPFLFERINDYTELLLPDDLTSQFSIVYDVVQGMTEADCQEVEIIGWLYQFYISEKKDEVFASKSKVKKEDIPAATQLFTPRWIVEYMVQNTVGKLWLQNKPNSKLREHMPYFIDSPSLESADFLKISSPEEIKLLDQACGSGHILVYGFDLLTKIYEEEGYSQSEIAQLILTNNLFGFEIDERAAQLAGMALLMKARSYQRRLFKKGDVPTPTILCYKDLTFSIEECTETLKRAQHEPSEDLLADLENMQQATNLGSLILPQASHEELQTALKKVSNSKIGADAFYQYQVEHLKTALAQLNLLADKYHCVVDNPPYMGGGKMNDELAKWVKINFPKAKSDILTCFIERAVSQVHEKGFMGFVTMESWMFLSSFEEFRKSILENLRIHSLSHFGWHVMRIAFGTVSFILENRKPKKEGFEGVYSYMEYDNIETKTERPIKFPIRDNGRFKIANQKDFEKILGYPIAYWACKNALDAFDKHESLGKNHNVKSGVMTGNDNLFIRFWNEVSVNNIAFNKQNLSDISNEIYLPLNKEEGFRKWSGRYKQIFRFENNGHNFENVEGLNYRLRNLKYYFNKGISWGDVTSSSTSYRFQETGYVFHSRAPMIFTENKILLGILNSKVVNYFQAFLNPTLSFNLVDLEKIPIAITLNQVNISIIINDCLEISIFEWNTKELSWNFNQNELIKRKSQDLEETYDLYQQYWKNKFFQLHKNEEELNRLFIEIYGLQDELTPDVSLEDITILKEETSIENGQLVFHADEVFKQFVSYAVGCMFGRYSLDKEGLILANQGETLEDYLSKIGTSTPLSDQFLPDEDNIIPILDDDWFEDDIVGRFYAFLKASFGEANFQKNLAFVEESLKKDMRKYFTKEFYEDHVKRYKKRPIYWMFSSPKGHFNVLVYMHRYTPDTLNNILNNYLREFIDKLKIRKEHLEQIKISGSAAEQSKAIKEIDKLDKMLLDCQEYEREILYNLATERISIDLDDGVLVNYNKFGKAIKEVKGLNDTPTKKKVREFDWIDVNEIR